MIKHEEILEHKFRKVFRGYDPVEVKYFLEMIADEIKKNARLFLYILFQILQITLAVLGGVAREEKVGGFKRSPQGMPMDWQSLMSSDKGKEIIGDNYKKETGVDLDSFGTDLDIMSEPEEEEEHVESTETFEE